MEKAQKRQNVSKIYKNTIKSPIIFSDFTSSLLKSLQAEQQNMFDQRSQRSERSFSDRISQMSFHSELPLPKNKAMIPENREIGECWDTLEQ